MHIKMDHLEEVTAPGDPHENLCRELASLRKQIFQTSDVLTRHVLMTEYRMAEIRMLQYQFEHKAVTFDNLVEIVKYYNAARVLQQFLDCLKKDVGLSSANFQDLSRDNMGVLQYRILHEIGNVINTFDNHVVKNEQTIHVGTVKGWYCRATMAIELVSLLLDIKSRSQIIVIKDEIKIDHDIWSHCIRLPSIEFREIKGPRLFLKDWAKRAGIREKDQNALEARMQKVWDGSE